VIPVWMVPGERDVEESFAWGGFVVRSNLNLPRLSSTDVRSDVGFRWRFDSAPTRGPALRQQETKTRTGGVVRVETRLSGQIRYQVEAVGLYEVRAEEGVIDFFPARNADPMQVEHQLLNAVLPIYAGLRGLVCLHASAVVEEGRATVFAGPSGSGKSTSAWKAVRRGGGLLGDDAVSLRRRDQGWLAHPCARTLRMADLPVEPAWAFGPKREAYMTSARTPAPLGQVIVLSRDAVPALDAHRAGLFRALLTLQAGWVWGDKLTRRLIVDATADLCDFIERDSP